MNSSANAWPFRRLLLAAYVGLLGAALFVTSLGIRVLLGRFLDHAREKDAREFCAESWQRLDLPISEFWTRGPASGIILSQELSLSQIEVLVRDLARPERPVRWRDARAAVIFQAGGRPGPGNQTAPPQPGIQWWALRLSFANHTIGTLDIGLDRNSDKALLHALGRYLIVCSLTVLLLAILLCSWLSKYWLRPLHTLADTMETLAEGDLTARPPLMEGRIIPSEWRRLRQSADDMARRLEDSFIAQRRFISDASHELRSPLTAVAAMAEMLSDEELSSQGREKAESTILRESHRMSRLVEDLLALSRAEEGRPLPQQNCSLLSTLHSLSEEFAELQPGREIVIQGSEAAALRAPVTLIRTVLRNLLENALRYSDGDVHCRVDDTYNKLQLTVSDTGCGIPEMEIEKVFERFYRADHSRSRATGGSGLGLAIVKALVQRTEGEIELESKVGVGTTVRVTWKKNAK